MAARFSGVWSHKRKGNKITARTGLAVYVLHAGFSVKTFLLQWTQLHFAAFRICFGEFFFLSLHLVPFLLPAGSVLRAVGKKRVTWGKPACRDTFVIPMEAVWPTNVSCWSFCTCNLCPEGSCGDILPTSWRAATVEFNVALEPTLLQKPLYRRRAVQDLHQDLFEPVTT